MANDIALANKFLPILDEIYKKGAATSVFDARVMTNAFTGVNEIKVLKVGTVGLGNYSRDTGYPKATVTAEWETMKLTVERGREFSVDRMDDEETLGMTFGAVVGGYQREHVVPELDAYRFAKYARARGILKASPAPLSKETIIGAIDEAVAKMDEAEVPRTERVLNISTALQPMLNSALARQWGSDGTVNTILSGYNDMPINWVVPGRFYTDITLNDGSSESGFKPTNTKDTTGKPINFMIIHKPAVLQVVKFALPKIFTPEENQDKDAWKFQFRLYHDAFVYDKKAKGIYLHAQA